jgi:hypothetical protein
VEERNVNDLTPVEAQYGVPQAAKACHTAVVDGYVVVGHVPVDAIRKMLKDRPDIVGISVPGMPSGSPGMEGPKEPYDVVSFDKAGKITVIEKR